jgi:bifunctional enzyme CysN/CysC
MRFPVQYVNRTRSDFRGFCGLLAGGTVAPGDPVVVLPSGRRTEVAEVLVHGAPVDRGVAGQSLTLTLADEVDVSRGDMLVHAEQLPRVGDRFDARIVWMHDRPMLPGRQYDLKLAATEVPATPEQIHHRIDVNTLEHQPAEQLALNEIGHCRIRAGRALAFDAYSAQPGSGSFILIDRVSNLTVGAGMIVRPVTDALTDKSENVTWHRQSVDKRSRAAQKAQRPAVLWFTGLSGAGKSTVANALEQALFQRGHHSYLLDGDNVRHGLNRDLGFTDEDRVENIRRIGEVARLMADAGPGGAVGLHLAVPRGPRAGARADARRRVHRDPCRCAAGSLRIARPEGLYAKARAGVIRNFTGIDSPYEAPEHPEVVVNTDELSVDECVEELLIYLKRRGILIG